MIKCAVIGHYGEDHNYNDGQTIKTKTITEELTEKYGFAEIKKIDTHGGFKTLFKAPFISRKAFKNSRNVIIMPAQNGLRVFAPLCGRFKEKHPEVKLHYVVIGGWLPEFINKNRSLIKYLMGFDGIYVETSAMKKALDSMGFLNVVIMPNFKRLEILSEEELVYSIREPLKLCTFSRVMKEKGIEDAVNAVCKINEEYGKTVYELDIYGQVDGGQTQWFERLKQSFPTYIKYCGVVPFDKSVETIKNYYALLFPTHFYTEGIPGTVIDAFAAGVPVISSKWENFSDMIEEGFNGIGFEFESFEGLKEKLIIAADNPESINSLKKNCLSGAEKYTTKNAMKIITQKLDET